MHSTSVANYFELYLLFNDYFETDNCHNYRSIKYYFQIQYLQTITQPQSFFVFYNTFSFSIGCSQASAHKEAEVKEVKKEATYADSERLTVIQMVTVYLQ